MSEPRGEEESTKGKGAQKLLQYVRGDLIDWTALLGVSVVGCGLYISKLLVDKNQGEFNIAKMLDRSTIIVCLTITSVSTLLVFAIEDLSPTIPPIPKAAPTVSSDGAPLGLFSGTPSDELLLASEAGDRLKVEKLLENNNTAKDIINIVREEDDATPLSIAVEYGFSDIVALLLSRGADPNIADADGVAPLYIASQNGDLDMVRQIITAGGRLDQLTILRSTPLFAAAQAGKSEIVAELLTLGANLHLARKDGNTPLHIASKLGHVEVLTLLLNKKFANVNVANTWTRATPLFLAAQHGQDMAMVVLIDRGASLDAARETDGCTPLHAAASAGHTSAVNLLLMSGADATMTNNIGKTPMAIAAEYGHATTAEALRRQRSKVAPPTKRLQKGEL